MDDVVRNLSQRFPDAHEDDIRHALTSHAGHAGRAAKVLKDAGLQPRLDRATTVDPELSSPARVAKTLKDASFSKSVTMPAAKQGSIDQNVKELEELRAALLTHEAANAEQQKALLEKERAITDKRAGIEIERLRATLLSQEAALAEKDKALAEKEKALSEKHAALMQKTDELEKLRLKVYEQQGIAISIAIDSANALQEVQAKLAEKILELPGQKEFLVRVVRVDETSSKCMEEEAMPEEIGDHTLEEESCAVDHELGEELTESELTKVHNLAARSGSDKKSCLSVLKHHAWHAGKAAQFLKKVKDGVEETTGIAAMSQSDLVNDSIEPEDMRFAASFPSARSELQWLKNHLKTAGSPEEILEIPKFIAQGTAGWVFEAERKSTGKRQAMKIMRMTQVRTGLREWYISKLIRNWGSSIYNVVLTDEDVYVLHKKRAPKVVSSQLELSGPVQFFACFIQEFMGGGNLEGLALKGQLTQAVMLKSLATVSETLAAMHRQLIQHRDVKPENVLLEMKDGALVSAKLCDLGSAEMGENPQGEADDVRRFGVTFFAVAAGEPWTKNALIRAKHEDLIERMKLVAAGFSDGPMKLVPEALREILQDSPSMHRVSQIMSGLCAAV